MQRLSLSTSLEEVRQTAAPAARRLLGADGAALVLHVGEDRTYVEEDAGAPLWSGQRLPPHNRISDWVIRHRSPVVIEDADADSRLHEADHRSTSVTSMAMTPVGQLAPRGALGAYWSEPHRATDQEVALLQAVADSTAVAVESVLARGELEQARLEVLDRLALAAEYRDDATREHTLRVARTALLLAQALGLSATEAALIGQAAPLHDVGKLTVPEAVLLKPGRLSEAEFEQIKEHTTAGAAILAGGASGLLRRAGEIALTHHERWDGAGYPGGLEAQAIPISGRIVALADVFDALTHERPYKSAWPIGAATAEIRRLSARQFDPRVVDAFLSLEPERLAEPTQP